MASPAYEDFTDQFGATRSSTPAVEDRDNHPLRYGPGVKKLGSLIPRIQQLSWSTLTEEKQLN